MEELVPIIGGVSFLGVLSALVWQAPAIIQEFRQWHTEVRGQKFVRHVFDQTRNPAVLNQVYPPARVEASQEGEAA